MDQPRRDFKKPFKPKPFGKPMRDRPPFQRAGAARPAYPRRDRERDHDRPSTDWAGVADWYDALVGKEGSEYQQQVVFPKTLHLLGDVKGKSILDIACGQGAFCRVLYEKGATAVGVDSAGPLIEKARLHNEDLLTGPSRPHIPVYHRADARELKSFDSLRGQTFHAGVCLLAIQNIDPIEPVFEACSKYLADDARFVIVMMHPAFRGPKFTSWGWDDQGVQYRRVDRYLVPRREPIVTSPGKKDGKYTWTFHRPLADYFAAARDSGWIVEALDEWASHKHSDSGPRANSENIARSEIPMFLALRLIRAKR